MGARTLILLSLAVAAHTLTMDPEATNNAIAAAMTAQNDGEVAIVIRPHSRGVRKAELLHVKGEDHASVSLFLNKKSRKVTLESLHGGNLKSVSWGLGTDTSTTLTLVVSPRRVKLFAGCRPLHHHALEGRFDLLSLLANDHLKLYHEESVPVEIYGKERAALDSINCVSEDTKASLVSVEGSDMVDVKPFDERANLEDEMQGDDYRTNYIDANGVLPSPPPPRGDIPSTDVDCDEKVFRQLDILSKLVEKLRREIADQKGTIDRLNGQLRECCKGPGPAPVERCTSATCHRGY